MRYTFPHIAFISRSKAPFNFPLSPSFFSFRLLCLYPLQDTILHQRRAARCGRVALGTGQVPGLGVKLVRSTIGMMVQGPSEALSLVQIQPRLHQFINRSPPGRPPRRVPLASSVCHSIAQVHTEYRATKPYKSGVCCLSMQRLSHGDSAAFRNAQISCMCFHPASTNG